MVGIIVQNSRIQEVLLNSNKSVIRVSELRSQGFSDEEIRSLTWDLPEGWHYSEPSWSQMSDPSWWKVNFSNIVQMYNGALCLYFYQEGVV